MKSIKKIIIATAFFVAIMFQADSFARSTKAAVKTPAVMEQSGKSIGASVDVDKVINTERQNIEQMTIETEKIKTAATIAINAAYDQLAKGEISRAQAAKIVGEQNYKIQQAEKMLSLIVEKSVAKVEEAEGYLSRLVSGVKSLYEYSGKEKELAQAIIDELQKEFKKIEKEYALKMQAASPKARMQAINEWNAIKQEFENEIYKQEVITGKEMGINKKLFWGAVGFAGVAIGTALAYKYFGGGIEMPPEEPKIPTPAVKAPVIQEEMRSHILLTPEEKETSGTIPLQEQKLLITTKEASAPNQEIVEKNTEEPETPNAKQEKIDDEILKEQIEWQNVAWAHKDLTDAEFEEFVIEHTPPNNIEQLIKHNEKELAQYNYLPLKTENGPIVAIAKGEDIKRVFNVDALRDFIKDNQLNSLEAPQKWVANVNGEWRVFAEYINGEPISQKNPLNLQETQDLVFLMERTGFSDFDYGKNVIRDDKTGKLAFIDVEDDSFKKGGSRENLVANLLFNIGSAMNTEASEWLENYYNNLQKNSEGESRGGYLPVSGKWYESTHKWLTEHPEEAVTRYLGSSPTERIGRDWKRKKQEAAREAAKKQ